MKFSKVADKNQKRDTIASDEYPNVKKCSEDDSSLEVPLKEYEPRMEKRFLRKCFAISSYFLFFITLPFSLCFTIKIVHHHQKAVIYRLGYLVSSVAKGPGLFFILPCIENYFLVDMRTVCYNAPTQEVLTKDSVTIQVDAVVFYHTKDAIAARNNVVDADYSTQSMAQTVIRNVLVTKSLCEIRTNHKCITRTMQKQLEEATSKWGVTVERLELKEIKIPELLQKAMTAEIEATKEANAKLIAAEGELQASKSLRDAAEIKSKTDNLKLGRCCRYARSPCMHGGTRPPAKCVRQKSVC